MTKDNDQRSMLTFDLSAKVMHIRQPSIHSNIFFFRNQMANLSKVEKRAKIRNRCNQSSHLTQDTNLPHLLFHSNDDFILTLIWLNHLRPGFQVSASRPSEVLAMFYLVVMVAVTRMT